MMRKVILPTLVVLVSIFGAVTLMATSPTLQPTVPQPIAPTVRVQEVELKAIQLKVHSQGSVSPDTESELIPEVSGRIIWISSSLRPGGYFNAGDVLLQLDKQDYQSAAEKARANLTRAKAEYQHARFEHQRLASLEERQLVSRSQLENSLRAHRVAEAALQDAEASINQALRDLERTEIKAPFTGLVRDRAADIGQFVGRGTPIATLYASDQVEVRLPIADRQLAFLNLPVGQRGELPKQDQPNVTLSAQYAGRALEWKGKIVRTEAQIDTASRMVHVVARVANTDHEAPLSVGLFVNAEIEGLLVDNLAVVPRNALRNGNRVLIVNDENELHYRDVDPLRLYQDDVLIQGGLANGERVCVSPLQTAIEGMMVNPVLDISIPAAGY